MTETQTIVAFDEAGNTGQDLLNAEQPVFVLSAVSMHNDMAMCSIEPMHSAQSREIKFSQLRKRAGGERKILSLLESNAVSSASLKMYAIDKSFLVTTKITDVLVETVTKLGGIEFYQRGANIAYANMLHAVMPAFAGLESTRIFREYFVAMMRQRTSAAIEDFYRFTDMLYESVAADHGRENAFFLLPVRNSRMCIEHVMKCISDDDLDPIIPAFVRLSHEWGEQLGCRFKALCDEARAIAADRDVLLALSHREEPDVEVGFDTRKAVFPLKIDALEMADSKTSALLQVADVAASSLCHAVTRAKRGGLTEFAKAILSIVEAKQLVTGAIYPSSDVTPESLGTTEMSGTNIAAHAAAILQRRLP
jgi:hypothetical protein